MARKITHRYELTGTLEAVTPLHVGGYGTDPDTDLPLARNGRGDWYVPGTTLAGALRVWSEVAFGNADFLDKLWGFQESPTDGDSARGHASYLTICDAVLSGLTRPEIRDGVGLDRCTGAAATHIKYDRAVLPRGTRFPFRLRADIADDVDNTLKYLAALQDALTKESIRFGAAKTRGLGRVKLVDGQLKQATLHTKQGILAFLRNGCTVVAAPEFNAPALPQITVTIQWQPLSPVMVKAGFDGIAVDMLPLVSGVGDGVAPVLPGSSLKGALRSRAEMIVRTLRNLPTTPDRVNKRQAFLHDTNVELVNDLFGAREDGRPAHPTASKEHLGQGVLFVDDCYAKEKLPLDEWKQIANANLERELWQTLDKQKRPWQQAFHVAIDRWTGGAAESFLYSVLEPHAVAWEPLKLTITLHRLPKEIRPLAVGLLFQVLRDLAARRIPLGFATNRGMGDVAVKSIHIDATATDNIDLPSGQYELFHNARFTIPEPLHAALAAAWKQWLQGVAQR